MSAVFIRPLEFTAATTNPAPIAGTSTAYLNLDTPGLVWRGATTSYIILDLGTGSLAYDHVALIGTNMLATGTVQVRTGTTTSGTGGHAGTATAAWSGIKPDLCSAKTIVPLGSIRSERFVRIDVVSTNPVGYVEIQRVVIGKAATAVGIEYGADLNYEERNDTTTGLGFEMVQEGDFVPSMKIKTGWVYEAEWRTNWTNIMTSAALRRAVLFIPDTDTPANWITDAIFGRLSKGGGKAVIYNAWVYEGTITGLSM